jgi:hypothetical protein
MLSHYPFSVLYVNIFLPTNQPQEEKEENYTFSTKNVVWEKYLQNHSLFFLLL